MKNLINLALLGGAMTLVACGGDKDGDSAGDTGGATTGTATGGGTGGGTATGGGTTDDQIVAVQASCPTDAAFSIVAETNFSISDALLNIWEVNAGATGWDEEHALVGAPVAGAAGDDATWNLTDDSMWVNGTETLFSCGVHDVSAAMVYVARVYDTDGNYEDCGAWGGEAGNISEVLATPAGGGDVTDYNGVSDAAEITAANCFVF
ncbi:MAG: hypothetical protein ACI8PZ_005428 [Myxococcota bacterium]|jgi:hypothetical protein